MNITIMITPTSSSINDAENEANPNSHSSNDGCDAVTNDIDKDSDDGVTKYEVIDKIDAGGNNSSSGSIHNENNCTTYDDVKEKKVEEGIKKQDDNSAISNESTWEYIETDVHKILTKDLWRSDLTEDDIYDYVSELHDLCLKYDAHRCQFSPIKSKQDIFYRLRGYTILIGLMNQFKNNIEMLWNCLEIVGNVCKDHQGLVRHFVYAGVMDRIVAIMNRHPYEESLQIRCLEAIKVFTVDAYDVSKQLIIGASATTTPNDGTANSAGTQAIIRATQKFPEYGGIQKAGCQVLCNMSYKDLAERIIDAGATGVLAVAIEQHSSNPSIKEVARKAMIELLS